jgi:hypothetical protein
MPNLAKTSRNSPMIGTGRLRIASTYFTLVGATAAVGSAGIIAAIVVPRLAVHIPANPYVALASALSLAIGSWRTSRLLDQRRKEGLVSAMIFLAAPLAGFVAGAAPGLPLVSVSLAGLGLLASVWPHLHAEPPAAPDPRPQDL